MTRVLVLAGVVLVGIAADVPAARAGALMAALALIDVAILAAAIGGRR